MDLIKREDALNKLSRGEGCGNVCRNLIRSIPSVSLNAIPIEFIQNQIDMLNEQDNEFAKLSILPLRVLLQKWEEENK